MSSRGPVDPAPLLEVRGLCVDFGARAVVDGFDLVLRAGERLALVGESGSGKTLAALAVLGLLPDGARSSAARLAFRGRELCALRASERRGLLGRELAMSFQEAASALNPVLDVGEQIAEPLRQHAGLSRRAARARALELLGELGIADAAERAHRYAHELSGGQRQRVMLAIALACGPSLLIADEPTRGLDASVQVEILALLCALVQRREMALLVITHDLAVVRETAERVAVMYAGRIVEQAPTAELFARPRHPYTVGLLRSRPDRIRRGERFAAIPGSVPGAGDWPSGCRFHPRCALADERCRREMPELAPEAGAQRAACHHAGEAPLA